MTTKAPAQVEKFAGDTPESISYKIADEVKTREPNDKYRLGYHIWRYITGTIPSVEEAVRVSGIRLAEGETIEKVTELVSSRLKEHGFEVKGISGK
jgi:hypothetical protein